MEIVKFYFNPQLPRFLLLSGLAAAANLVLGYLLYEGLGLKHGWQYGFSVAVAFLAGMAVSFTLNRRFTFEPSRRSASAEMGTFFIVSMGGLLLTVALAYLFRIGILPRLLALQGVSVYVPAGLSVEMLSHVLAVGLVTVYSFSCHKLFSFGKGFRYYFFQWRRGHSTQRQRCARPG